MSPSLAWSNVAMYSLQLGLLVGLAAFVPGILRLEVPRAKLVYWQILLVVCLLLPVLQPWRQELIIAQVEVTTTVLGVRAGTEPARVGFTPAEIALLLLAAGATVRLGWLAAGLWRLRGYRRHAHPLPDAEVAGAALLLSSEIPSPVTFGLRRPVILLPERFTVLDSRTREAILCHELLHVERRDWLFAVMEELVRAIFWFHPAIWWLLGEIQLSREQTVDQEVVRRTRAREEYLDALLTFAGAPARLDLAPAPLFLRKRHLRQRVVSVLQEVRMSKKRLITGFACALAMLVGDAWLVSGAFPLLASPQVVSDETGVTVDLGSGSVLHRTPVRYPEQARRSGVQGTVTVEATLDAGGNVRDARVLSGPDELRRAALESVLGWHFSGGAPGATRQVSMAFRLPAGETVLGIRREQLRVSEGPDRPRPAVAGPPRTMRKIEVAGLPDSVRDELLSRLPAREGEAVTPEKLQQMSRAVKEFDEHLTVETATAGTDQAAVTIAAPGAKPLRLRIGGAVQQSKLVRQPRPAYPPEAKEARIQGTVTLSAVIGKDGTMQQLEVVSGHPMLVPAAMDAVRQWVYQPTLLNNDPVEIITQIDVNFTLSQ